MKYGDIVKGDCQFCRCVNFGFMDKKKGYILGRCLGCGWTQWVKVC